MKKISIILSVIFGSLVFTSCSKGDCVCTSTTSENGVITSTSSTTSTSDSGIPGPLGNLYEEDCDGGDYYSSNSSNGSSHVSETKCELE
jgi:hypothetical protein